MKTVEFMQKELQMHRQNYETLIANNAPKEDVEFAKMKLSCCIDVCKVLKAVVAECQS